MKVLKTYIESEFWRHASVFKDCNALVLGESTDGVMTRHLTVMFSKFHLKSLACITCEKPQLTILDPTKPVTYSVYDGKSWKSEEVHSSGIFTSEFVQSILKGYDVIFGIPDYYETSTYINALHRLGKKFLILGHIGSVFDKGVFELFRKGEVHLGFTLRGGHLKVMEEFENEFSTWNRRDAVIKGGTVQLQNYRWICNTGEKKYNLPYRNYYVPKKRKYGKFDNVDAVNIPNYKSIPLDCTEVVGTTPLLLDIMRDDEFELLYNHTYIKGGVFYKKKQTSYRIFVKRKQK